MLGQWKFPDQQVTRAGEEILPFIKPYKRTAHYAWRTVSGKTDVREYIKADMELQNRDSGGV